MKHRLIFRVRDTVNNIWELNPRIGVDDLYETEDEQFVVQQYSTINDIAGQKIFEGDYVSGTEYLGETYQDRFHEHAVVIFQKGAFWYSLDGGKNPHALLMNLGKPLVKGNIFDN